MNITLVLFTLLVLSGLGWLIWTRFQLWVALAAHFPPDGAQVPDDFDALSRNTLTIRRWFVFRWVHAIVFERGMLIHTAFMLRPTGVTMFIPWSGVERIEPRMFLGDATGVDVRFEPGAPEEVVRISSRAFAAAVEKFAPETLTERSADASRGA